MTNIFLKSSVWWILAFSFFSCKKETMPEPKPVQPILQRSPDYYANLRAYKKTDHPIFFGWFGGSGGSGDAKVPSMMDEIPDSVDIVSLWGGFPAIGSYYDSLMQQTRQLKGTKFVWVMFGSGVTNLMQQNFPALSMKDTLSAIDSVAKSIADTIALHHVDGFDLDYEPDYGDGGIFGHNYAGRDAGGDILTQHLFKAFSRYLGPLSGSGKTLIIDGESEAGIANNIDYLIQQAYGASTTNELQFRFQKFGFGTLPAKKFVVAASFEDPSFPNLLFSDPVHGNIPIIYGMAYWNPTEGRKGGCGAYHAEYDYASNPDYIHVREAIQIMNPAAH